MSAHMFAVGQFVHFHPSGFRCAAGSFQVVRQLPADEKGCRHYRIRGAHEPHDRVVVETQLSEALRTWS